MIDSGPTTTSPSTGRPLTILQLTHQGGGAGSTQSILDLSRYLAQRGHRVLVGCRPGILLARAAAEAGLTHLPLEFAPFGRLTRALARALEEHGVEVVNSHATRDRRALAWLRWQGRLPQAFVVTRRTMPLTWFPEIVAIGATADRTIAVSHEVATALRHRLHEGSRLRVVPNGIALERLGRGNTEADLAWARERLGPLEGRRVIAVLARRKDQDVLIRALAEVRTPAVAALVGIEADETLRRLAEATPARHRIVFVPFTDQPLSFYRLADLAALPSRIEGLSAALLEAMALGLPVVASDAGGNRNMIRNEETGLLVPPLDVPAWSRALDRLLGDPALATRLARAGCDRVKAEFTLERTAARTEAVYREALERREARKRLGARAPAGG